MGDKYQIIFQLDGKEVNPPKDWTDIAFDLTFGNDQQPVIEKGDFTFVNESAQFILQWIEDGKIFEGIPFEIYVNADSIIDFRSTIPGPGTLLVYRGVLDTTEMDIISPVEVKIKLKPDEGLDLLDQRLAAISMGYLASLTGNDKGFIDQEHYIDVPVVIRKKFDGVEVAMIGLSLYLIQKEIRETVKDDAIKTIKSLVVILQDPTSKPAAIVEAIAYALLLLAYAAAMLVLLINMATTLRRNLLPRFVKYKGIKLRTALERVLDRLDMTLDCNIPELDYLVYLPSKTDNKIRKNRKDEGIPNTDDYGYQASEMFSLVYDLFDAQSIQLYDNGKRKLLIRPRKSDDFRKLSNYVLPDDGGVLNEKYKFNADEMKANFLISFLYDATDEYTMPNARDTPFDSKKADEEKNRYEKGVSYEVITDLVSPGIFENKLIKGFEEVRIPMALGTRRNNLSVLEQTAKVLFAGIDLVISLFGGKTIGESIDEGRGRLIISHNSFSIPKLIPLIDGHIPTNHRDLLSARALYNNYHFFRSFKTNPLKTQARIYTIEKIPFGLADFVKVALNSNFTTADGKEGRFRNLSWTVGKDTATATYEVYEQFVTPDALIETFIEP